MEVYWFEQEWLAGFLSQYLTRLFLIFHQFKVYYINMLTSAVFVIRNGTYGTMSLVVVILAGCEALGGEDTGSRDSRGGVRAHSITRATLKPATPNRLEGR